MKKTKKILFLLASSCIILFACNELNDTFVEDEDNNLSIEAAKNWYETNRPDMMQLKSSDDKYQVLMKPAWTYAFVQADDEYKVVETDITSKGRVRFLDKECMDLYEQTQDELYGQCITRLVFRTNKKDGNTTGFLMTITPDLDWLKESDFKPFRNMSYIRRNPQFGGQILYHDMEGKFVNGWKYREGKVVASVEISDNDDPGSIQLRASNCHQQEYYSVWQQCTDYYQYVEVGGQVSPTTYNGTSCKTYSKFEGYIHICENDGSGSYSGGGGTPSSSSYPVGHPKSIFRYSSLDKNGEIELNREINDLMKFCEYENMSQYMMDRSFVLKDIVYDPKINAIAYIPTTKTLVLRESSVVTSLREEFVHMYQDVFYPGGIAQYSGRGKVNIEFEAKLIQDIICTVRGLGCPTLGATDSNRRKYQDWITKLVYSEGGDAKIPIYENIISGNEYWQFMEEFRTGKPGYNYPVDPYLKPQALRYMIQQFGCPRTGNAYLDN